MPAVRGSVQFCVWMDDLDDLDDLILVLLTIVFAVLTVNGTVGFKFGMTESTMECDEKGKPWYCAIYSTMEV